MDTPEQALSSPAGPAPRDSRGPGSKGWVRTGLKWCRIFLLLLLLVVVLLLLFLNHVGLPDWLNRRVEEQFRKKGWELQYSRLRLRWYRGIVADDLQLRRIRGATSPHLFLQTAEFQLNWQAFWHFDLEANSILLRNGRLFWELPGTNQARRTLLLNRVGGQVLFLPNDVWELKFLETEVLGAHVRFRGELTNASFIREWRIPKGPPREPREPPGQFWNRFVTEAEKIHFDGRPELQVVLSGDAQNWKTFDAQVKFAGEGLAAPWGAGTNLALVAHLLPSPRTNDSLRAELHFSSQAVRTPWGLASDLDLTLVTEPSLTQLLPTNTLGLLELKGASNRWGQAERLVVELRSSPSTTNAGLNLTHLDVSIERLRSRWLSAGEARSVSTGLHPATDLLPVSLDSLVTLHDAVSPWATSRWAQVSVKADLPPQPRLRLADPNLPWPDRIEGTKFSVSGAFSNLFAPAFSADRAAASVEWRPPRLGWEANAERAEADGRVKGDLDTQTRELRFQARARAQPAMLGPFLGTNSQPWLSVCTFAAPPRIQLDGRLVLPAWTNQEPEWRSEVWPSVEASGKFESEAGQCRGVRFLSAQVPFALTNLAWSSPGLSILRPEGRLEVAGAMHPPSGAFRASVHSGVDPLALRPAFPQPAAQSVFDLFEFHQPPRVDGDVEGNWRDWSRLNGRGAVAVTNSLFRGQTVRSCTARVVYTNEFLSILHPQVLRDGEDGRADGIGIALERAHPRLFLTNAVGRMSPRVVTQCIGAEADLAVAPYVFELPAMARVEGSIPLNGSDGTEDMRFEVSGGPFRWQRFRLEQVQGTVLWRGYTLELTNVVGRWHGAELAGWAHFDNSPKDTNLFNFLLRVDHADLRTVLKDLQPGKSGKVEGDLSGVLRVTSADSANWQSWQGQGSARLTNGLLWDIPLLGVFSPVLNAFLPGLGHSRARHATATYAISNSVIYSQDVVIRGPILRMNYQGSVGFDQRVDGRMEAVLLRDMPALGFLVSKLLWPVTKLFDYRITGTLDQPKTEEVYLFSRILMMPLHPLKTLKDLMKPEEKPEERKPEEKPPP